MCRQQLLSANNASTAKAAILYFIIQTRAKLQKVKLPAGWMKMMDAEQVVIDGYQLIDFIYTENSLTKAPEKRIKLPGLISPAVYAPLDGFQNITCGEFEDAEIPFYEFLDTPGVEPLVALASILWRPKKLLSSERVNYVFEKKGDIKTYDSKKLHRSFSRLHPWQLYAIFTWYHGCRNQLPLLFPTVHSNHGASNNDEPDIMAFTKCIHSGAGPKNGSRNDIRRSKLFEFMYDMEQEAIKAEELKQEYEKMRK